MNLQRDILGLALICLTIVLLSLAGLAWAFSTALAFTLDGLLLILICLMMGSTFSLMLMWLAKNAGWFARQPSPGKNPAAGAAPAENPVNPSAREGK
jgi:hypothetical protein